MREFSVAKALKEGTYEYHMSHGPINVVFCGDSVTHGCLNHLGNHFDTVYHARLRMMLNTAYPDLPVNIINNGVGGLCADYAVNNFDRDVKAYHPALVVVCYGLNDEQTRMAVEMWGEVQLRNKTEAELYSGIPEILEHFKECHFS